MMAADLQDELSGRLSDAREGNLDDTSSARLDDLMGVYRSGLIRKARGWREAVARGLRTSLPMTAPIMPRDRIPPDVEQRVREAAVQRCGYGLTPQRNGSVGRMRGN
jgi:hypothetical protein